MGDVVLRESCKRSPKFDNLNWFEEVLAIRLMTIADENGLVDGRPLVIRNMAFPTKDSISTKAVELALKKLVSVGVLSKVDENDNGVPCFEYAKELFEPKPKIIIINNNTTTDSINNNNSLELRDNDYGKEDNDSVEHNDRTKNDVITEGNPFSYDAVEGTKGKSARAQYDTVQSYVTRNLSFMSSGQLDVLQTYIDDMPEELIRLAVDEACGGGFSRRNWNYLKAILDNWEECGYKTVADVMAAKEARKAKKKAKKNGTVYTEMNYDEDW